MRYRIYSVYDNARKAYSPLQLFDTHEAAIRAFKDLVNDENGIIVKSPQDFSIRFLGYFNVDSGEISQPAEEVDTSASFILAQELYSEPKDDKITALLNRIRRLESHIQSIEDLIDQRGDADNE